MKNKTKFVLLLMVFLCATSWVSFGRAKTAHAQDNCTVRELTTGSFSAGDGGFLTSVFDLQPGDRWLAHVTINSPIIYGIDVDYLNNTTGEFANVFTSSGFINVFSWVFTAPSAGSYDFQIELFDPISGFSTSGPGTVNYSFRVVRNCDLTGDGRLCNWDNAAIYVSSNDITIYGIKNGNGFFALSISKEEIAEFPANPTENTLLESSSDGVYNLYRLVGGNFQVNVNGAGKVNVTIWTGMPASHVVCTGFNT